MVFDKQKGTNFVQVIRLAVHWIEQWSFLLPVDQWEPMVIGCNQLLTVAQHFYFQAT
jgi:two-component response regulator (ARR-B family)